MNRETWYMNPEVLYNFVTVARDREICFLSKGVKGDKAYPVRHVFANYMKFLADNFKAFSFYERPYNLYYSLAKYGNIRLFSFSPSKRREQSDVWNKEAVSNTVSFDFGLDFDPEDLEHWKDAWEDCKRVKDSFDKYGVPYSLKFSGGKGFHLRVPHHALPQKVITDDVYEPDSLFTYLKSVAELMVERWGLPTLDLGIFDPRRVWKMDYSWTVETGLIVLPLSDQQFEFFSPSICEPLTVLKGGIRNRGTLERSGVPDAFKNFLVSELGVE